MHSPAFGQADLTNCERELIHLAGSIQPHGVLLVLNDADLTVQQASANTGAMLGFDAEHLLGRSVAALGGNVESVVRGLSSLGDLLEPAPLQCHAQIGDVRQALEGEMHRLAAGGLIVELEPVERPHGSPAAGLDSTLLQQRLAAAVQGFSAAASVGVLADAAVRVFRD